MKKQFKGSYIVIGIMFALLLSGCKNGENEAQFTTGKEYASLVKEEDTQEAVTEETAPLYVLTGYDTASKTIYLKKTDSLTNEEYRYTGSTCFYNKYGDLKTIASFEIGDAVTIAVSQKDDDTLSQMTASEKITLHENVEDFSLDLEKGILSFEGKNYACEDDTLVFHGGERVSVNYIKEGDTLSILEDENRVVSIRVTSGEGTVLLTNTSLFEGGWLNIDNRIYLVIEKDMQIPLAEGTHTLTVANDGYGDTTELTVERTKTVIVDLDTLKGEGPKYALLRFETEIEGTEIYVDGQKVPENEEFSVKYGTHLLEAKADGYDTWTRRLVVNSEKAVIQIDVSKDSTTTPDTETETTETTVDGTLSDTTGSTTTDTTASDSSSDVDVNELYLDTLSGLMQTLIGSDDDE